MLPSARFLLLSTVLMLTGAMVASAAERFSMAVGSHDLLTVFNAQGERKAELPLPAISQTVVVDGMTFQVSYGRDADNLLTAIVAPNPTEPQDLHFNVLGKSIDTDKQAVVTLTFSKNLSSVRIDPGYIGKVEVNAHRMQRDSAANRGMQHAPLLVAYTPPVDYLERPGGYGHGFDRSGARLQSLPRRTGQARHGRAGQRPGHRRNAAGCSSRDSGGCQSAREFDRSRAGGAGPCFRSRAATPFRRTPPARCLLPRQRRPDLRP